MLYYQLTSVLVKRTLFLFKKMIFFIIMYTNRQICAIMYAIIYLIPQHKQFIVAIIKEFTMKNLMTIKMILAFVTALTFLCTIIFHLNFWCVLWALLLFCTWSGLLKSSIVPKIKKMIVFHLIFLGISVLNLIIASWKVFF